MMWVLKDLLREVDMLGGTHQETWGKVSISSIETDSRRIAIGSLFIACKGFTCDGHDFIIAALHKGAVCVISERPIPQRNDCVHVWVYDSQEALRKIIKNAYQSVLDKIQFIGITGTNGKTTCTYLVKRVLEYAGSPAALIGTIAHQIGSQTLPSENTTPMPVTLCKLASQIAQQGIQYTVMEVSSHALAQKRVEVVPFQVACFTNLTQDHLDYHATMEDYFLAKARLFNTLRPESSAVLNMDDQYGKRMQTETNAGAIITYSLTQQDATLYARNIQLNMHGASFEVVFQEHSYSFRTSLVGRHNVYNVLAAIGVSLAVGRTIEECQAAFQTPLQVPGRMERISSPLGYSVYIDYAHTDDALLCVLKTLREITQGKIIVVFGCGGDRDKTKRAKMGKVVSLYADKSIITSDNPRNEDPHHIIQEIVQGVTNDHYLVEPDRRKAIGLALMHARKEDSVLIAGKGHETYQVVKGKTIHFNDQEVVKEIFAQITQPHHATEVVFKE